MCIRKKYKLYNKIVGLTYSYDLKDLAAISRANEAKDVKRVKDSFLQFRSCEVI